MARPSRLVDRIADASVLLPTCLGALCLGGPDPCPEVFVICAGITCALHAWFRAEDRWRGRRPLRAARTSRAAKRRCGTSSAPRSP